MYDQDVRWYVLVPVTFILGFVAINVEIVDVWGTFPARPDWFWCLAVCATLKAPPVSSIFAFAWCGLARDFLLGSRPGSGALAFIAVGWLLHFWKPLAAVRGVPGRAVLAGMSAFIVALARHSLDYGALTYKLWDWLLVVSFGDALLTFVAFFPAAVVLGFPSFRPWREREGFYFP